MIRALTLVFIATLAVFGTHKQASSQAYTIGENDTLSIRVFEWMAIEGEVREWPSLTGNYVVSEVGTVSLPFLGEFFVAGRSTEEIAAQIGADLKQNLALQDKPTASVEIARYRPIYITGRVEAPGQYEYEPGLTVRMAVATAGGIERNLDDDNTRAVITSMGNLRIFDDRYLRLIVRRARIEAELSGINEIGSVPEIERSSAVEVMLADEQAIMTARAEALERTLTSIERRKQLLTTTIQNLETKMIADERQLQIAREELENARSLAERGLETRAGVFDRERFLADMEANVLDVSLALLEARQGLQNAERDEDATLDDRETELVLERQRLDAEIKELRSRQILEQSLLTEALDANARAQSAQDEEVLLEVSYTVVRNDQSGRTAEMEVDADAPLMPGDVIEVTATAPRIQ